MITQTHTYTLYFCHTYIHTVFPPHTHTHTHCFSMTEKRNYSSFVLVIGFKLQQKFEEHRNVSEVNKLSSEYILSLVYLTLSQRVTPSSVAKLSTTCIMHFFRDFFINSESNDSEFIKKSWNKCFLVIGIILMD